LGADVDDHHGVLFPRLACLLVPNTAPEVDDLLAAMISTSGSAQLSAASEVVSKCLVHGLKAMTDVSLNGVWFP
jgi:hypothetical protein